MSGIGGKLKPPSMVVERFMIVDSKVLTLGQATPVFPVNPVPDEIFFAPKRYRVIDTWQKNGGYQVAHFKTNEEAKAYVDAMVFCSHGDVWAPWEI